MLSKEDKSLASGCSTLGAEDGEAVSCKCWEKWIQPRTWLFAKLTPRWGKIDFRHARTQNLCLPFTLAEQVSGAYALEGWKCKPRERENWDPGKSGCSPGKGGWGERCFRETEEQQADLEQEEQGSRERKLWTKWDSWNKWDGRSLGQDKKQMDGRADRAFETQVLFT